QSGVDVRAHGDGHALDDVPVDTVGGLEAGHHVAAALKLHPTRGRAGNHHLRTGPAGGAAPLDAGAVGRGYHHERVPGIGVEIFADHHAGLGPGVGVGQRVDARDDVAVTAQRTVGEVKVVRGTADVAGTRAGERVDIGDVIVIGRAGGPDGADVGRTP